nr:MAG TPA: hypothetical protein [Caudoviricetes sp.]
MILFATLRSGFFVSVGCPKRHRRVGGRWREKSRDVGMKKPRTRRG